MASVLRTMDGRMHPARSTPARRFALVLGACLAGGVGCTSRTLPLPPPEVMQVSSPDENGLVTVQGRAREGASIGVVNDMNATGTIVTSLEDGCGSACPFEATLKAASGDQLRVWQFYETEGSLETMVP